MSTLKIRPAPVRKSITVKADAARAFDGFRIAVQEERVVSVEGLPCLGQRHFTRRALQELEAQSFFQLLDAPG